MKRVLFLVILSLVLPSPLYAIIVKNETARQDGAQIVFEYDLIGEEEAVDVELTIFVKDKSYSTDELHLKGSYGRVKTGNKKTIYWDVLKDFPHGFEGSMDWEITAEVLRLRYGLKGGISATSILVKDMGMMGAIIGYSSGVFITYRVTDWFTIQTEFLYVTKGAWAIHRKTSEIIWNFSYLEIPVLFKFGITRRVNLYLAPYFAYKLSDKVSINNIENSTLSGNTINVSRHLSSTGEEGSGNISDIDYGGIAGIDYNISSFTVDLRIGMGLASVDGVESAVRANNLIASLMIGYSL